MLCIIFLNDSLLLTDRQAADLYHGLATVRDTDYVREYSIRRKYTSDISVGVLQSKQVNEDAMLALANSKSRVLVLIASLN
jgi:hypothetical protein